MPTLLPSAQKGAEGVGGIRVSQHAPLRTRPPTGEKGPKSLQEHSAVIGKALERLNLSAVRAGSVGRDPETPRRAIERAAR